MTTPIRLGASRASGHIAFIGLGILNILLARELAMTSLGERARRVASFAMNLGNVLLPVTLFAAAAWRPANLHNGAAGDGRVRRTLPRGLGGPGGPGSEDARRPRCLLILGVSPTSSARAL